METPGPRKPPSSVTRAGRSFIRPGPGRGQVPARSQAAYSLTSSQGCSKVGPSHSKPETRRPKAERRPKEGRNPNSGYAVDSPNTLLRHGLHGFSQIESVLIREIRVKTWVRESSAYPEFGIRISAFFSPRCRAVAAGRISAFGLRISGLQNLLSPQLAGL
jgi:hypothetical protein